MSKQRILCDFNSIKVQLKLKRLINAIVKRLFQFHKGTIKTRYCQPRRSRQRHFNSIKVQLKRCSTPSISPSRLFQFHKGTIKTGQGFQVTVNDAISIP